MLLIDVTFSQNIHKPGENLTALIRMQNIPKDYALGDLSTTESRNTNQAQSRSHMVRERRQSLIFETSPETIYNSQEVGPDAASKEHILILHAQIHGQCVVDRAFVQHEAFENVMKARRKVAEIDKPWLGAIAEKGAWQFGAFAGIFGRDKSITSAEKWQIGATASLPILTEVPEVIALEVDLTPFESVHYTFSQLLPPVLPPSFIGNVLQMTYTLRLTVQRKDNSVHKVDFPFSILNMSGNELGIHDFTIPIPRTHNPTDVRSNAEQRSASEVKGQIRHRVLGETSTTLVRRNLTNERDESVTSETSMRAYHITKENVDGEVGILRLYGTDFIAGNFIEGNLDFRIRTVSCSKVVLAIEREEVIARPYASDMSDKKISQTRIECTKEHLSVICGTIMQLHLHIPTEEIGTFTTIPFEVQYSIVLKFWISSTSQDSVEERTCHAVTHGASDGVHGETFECRIPIRVLPREPRNGPGVVVHRTC